MTAGEPDVAACRALFTELEFTTLLQQFAPATDQVATRYIENASPAEIAKVVERVLARVSEAALPLVQGKAQ